MGILRADRIAGLGGANAIKGSVEMRGRQNLRVEVVNSNADFNLLDSDYTVECWLYRGGTVGTDNSLDQDLVMLWNNTNNRRSYGLYYDSSGNLGLIGSSDGTNSDMGSYHSYTFPDNNAWYHIAAVRISNTVTVYVNGTSIGSATVTGKYYENTVDNLVVGGQLSGTNYDNKIVQGFLSNVRIIIGDGIYTGNFTPPTNELTVTSNTKLLCCQSSGNILQEATGKKLIAYRSSLNDSFAKASTFTPNSPVGFSTTTDVGSQYGSTFDGFGNFATSTYMVPPGGNTRERNRGRGLIFGGYSPSPAAHVNSIQFINIQSFGNAQDFGDLSSIRSQMGAVSSSTRAVSCGGGSDTPSDYTDINTCEFVTIASTSNTTDFGDLSVSRQPYKASSNDTRGIIFGGYIHPANSNIIDFITIATTGNATDFGDEIDTNRAGASCSSTTRGIVAGGSPATNRISFVEIATTGNAQDFGDLLNSVVAPSGCSDKTRGVFAGGATPTAINVIQFITMSSTGDATDFGDLNTTEKVGSKGNSNSIRGIFSGGYDGGTFVNSISAITIATTGNAQDFGDISGTLRYAAGTSDSHGGLS